MLWVGTGTQLTLLFPSNHRSHRPLEINILQKLLSERSPHTLSSFPLPWKGGPRSYLSSNKNYNSSFLSIEPLSLIPLVQPSSRTCTIDATKIVNSIIEEIRKRATIWHQISGGVERAAVRSGKTIKKRRLFVKVSTERPLGSGKQITITGT